MATTFKLDPLSGDLDRTGGRAATLAEAQQLAQRITTALRFHRGEDRYDLSNGFPWDAEVFGRKVPARATQERIRAYVARIPGVRVVDSVRIEVDESSRKMRVFLSVNKGAVQVQGAEL